MLGFSGVRSVAGYLRALRQLCLEFIDSFPAHVQALAQAAGLVALLQRGPDVFRSADPSFVRLTL